MRKTPEKCRHLKRNRVPTCSLSRVCCTINSCTRSGVSSCIYLIRIRTRVDIRFFLSTPFPIIGLWRVEWTKNPWLAKMCCHIYGIEPKHAIPVPVMINSSTQILLGQKPVLILSELLITNMYYHLFILKLRSLFNSK